MNDKEKEKLLSNLELVGDIKLHELLQVDTDGYIQSFIGHNFMHLVDQKVMSTAMTRMNNCLTEVYDHLPLYIDQLDEKSEQIDKIGIMIEKCDVGLCNLKSIYQPYTEFIDRLVLINSQQKDRLIELMGA